MIIEKLAQDLQVGDLVAAPFKESQPVTHITHGGRLNVYVTFAEFGRIPYRRLQTVQVEVEDPHAGWHDCKCPLCGHEAIHSDKDDKTYCYRDECANSGGE